MSTNDKLADALSSAVIQMDMAGDCIEAGRYNEALLHVRSLMRSRREVLAEHAASLAAPPAQGEWQPIETAPEGVWVQVYIPEIDNQTTAFKYKGKWTTEHNLSHWHPLRNAPGASSQPAPAPVQVDDGWQRMTQAARDMQARHLDNHQGDVYHAMQSLVGRFGAPRTGPMIQDRSAQPPAPAPVQAVCNRNCDCVGECKAGVERPAAQPPAAGKAELPDAVVALRRLYSAYVRVLHAGRARILDLGGECDPVEQMEVTDPELVQARAAIAALAQQKVPDAIDLAQFRPAVRVWKQDCAAWGDDEGEAMAERLLATIDQQQEARK